MRRVSHCKKQLFVFFLAGFFATLSYAAEVPSSDNAINLNRQPGFFRFSFDDVKMPNNLQHMGLFGINYFADLTPNLYAGIGAYGAVTGTQGGLFALGFAGGLHHEFMPHWWGDVGMFLGGGGGKSSLVGGGLMLRPYVGIAYAWQWARVGVHYSYVTFPDGQIHGSQIGLDMDIPWDFYYTDPQNAGRHFFNFDSFHLPSGKFLDFQRNDFGLILQAYRQRAGTRSVNGNVEDGTIGIVGAELDHYMTDRIFWWAQAGGAFHGIPNGFMDVLGGLGYRLPLNNYGFALMPQLGIGAGGGGTVDTGGGILVSPQLGVQWPLNKSLAARVSGGYLWAPQGNLKAYTLTGEVLYHLDIATASNQLASFATGDSWAQGWRIQLLNQTYIHPQRNGMSDTSAINLIALQIDQFFTPQFFISYQAASAYSGNHAGGLASGMLGPGVQSKELFHRPLKIYAALLVGAAGGGSLALEGGSLIEPVVGVHYSLTPAIGVQASISEVKALRSSLNTPVVSAGIVVNFATLNQ